MKLNRQSYRIDDIRFEPETKYSLPIKFAAFARGRQERAINRLKNRLLQASLGDRPISAADCEYTTVANEAVALAWTTPTPLLVLPIIFEEKLFEAKAQRTRQYHIFNRSIWLYGKPGKPGLRTPSGSRSESRSTKG